MGKKILRIVAIAVGLCLLMSIPTMLLWNWLMPSIFGLRQITWLEALGLMLLVHFLFGTPSRGKSE